MKDDTSNSWLRMSQIDSEKNESQKKLEKLNELINSQKNDELINSSSPLIDGENLGKNDLLSQDLSGRKEPSPKENTNSLTILFWFMALLLAIAFLL